MKKNFFSIGVYFFIACWLVFLNAGCSTVKRTLFEIEPEEQVWISDKLKASKLEIPGPQTFPSLKNRKINIQNWDRIQKEIEEVRNTIKIPHNKEDSLYKKEIAKMKNWRDRLIAEQDKKQPGSRQEREKLENSLRDLLGQIEKYPALKKRKF